MLLLVGHVGRMDEQTNRPVTQQRRFRVRKFVLCMGCWRLPPDVPLVETRTKIAERKAAERDIESSH